jgi:hypothetical protein
MIAAYLILLQFIDKTSWYNNLLPLADTYTKVSFIYIPDVLLLNFVPINRSFVFIKKISYLIYVYSFLLFYVTVRGFRPPYLIRAI